MRFLEDRPDYASYVSEVFAVFKGHGTIVLDQRFLCSGIIIFLPPFEKSTQ